MASNDEYQQRRSFERELTPYPMNMSVVWENIRKAPTNPEIEWVQVDGICGGNVFIFKDSKLMDNK